MSTTLENRFYYLDNFHTVAEWISERYDALLNVDEQSFIANFRALPQESRALLVRMVIRKGELFRVSKLRYEEIGCARQAVLPLVRHGWVDDQALLTIDQLFGLLTKSELAQAFSLTKAEATLRKADLLEVLRPRYLEARCFEAWHADSEDCVYRLLVTELCDRLRLMFFGNLRQDWTEFVLADLGIYRYEKVEFSDAAIAFRHRQDVDTYLHLHRCRERFEEGECADAILEAIPAMPLDNPWIETRRTRLIFHFAQHYERQGEWQRALELYAGCEYPGARVRHIRVLERCEQFEQAYELARTAADMPESESEIQQLMRILPRLRRKLGHPREAVRTPASHREIALTLAWPEENAYVEELVRRHVEQDVAPAFYVENTLINSLFGLLCWKAIFAPVPGAFFHPFHTGPADLYSPDFVRRREQDFADCLRQLESDQYKQTIRQYFAEKAGIQSPFVAWGVLSETLLELALACIPASHLRACFERILLDIPANRTGFPDLIQFWPEEQRYRMIEVKGPGDRLQDNQLRWLDYFAAHEIPVTVCYVQRMEQAA